MEDQVFETIKFLREAVLVNAWQVLGPIVLFGWGVRFFISVATVRWGGARPRPWYSTLNYLTLLCVAVLAANTFAMSQCDKPGAKPNCKKQFIADRSILK